MKLNTQNLALATRNSQFFELIAFFGILFLITADSQLLIPLLPLLRGEFSVSLESLSRLFSGFALAAAIAGLMVGPLTDRWGRILFLRLGLLTFTLLALATSGARNYLTLLGLRTTIGASAGILSTCVGSLMGDRFPYQRRGKAMGVVLSSYFAAFVVGIPAAAWLAQKWQWQIVFLASSALATVVLLFSLFLRPDRGTGGAVSTHFGAYFGFFRRRETASALAVSFAVSGATLAFLTFLSGHLDEAFGLGPLEIASLFFLVGWGAVLGSPVAGWLSDRWTKRGVFVAANILLALLLLILDHLAWGPALFIAFFSISLCIAFRQTALHTVQTELVSIQERGSFIALRNGFSQLGISTCVFLAGNLYSAGGFGSVLILAAALTLVASLLFYLTIPEPRASSTTTATSTSTSTNSFH